MNEANYRLFLEGCVNALLRGQPLDGPAWPGATQTAGQVLLMLDLAKEIRDRGDETAEAAR
jgi:hypothetical protein